MKSVTLFRTQSGDQGTFGILVFDGQHLRTGELPWRDNRANCSRIPAGKYTVRLRRSSKYGNVFHVQGVQGRTYILFHHGNFCGDRGLGFRSNTQGCILLGFRKGKIYGQEAILSSKLARRRFESVMELKPFKLEIFDVGITR